MRHTLEKIRDFPVSRLLASARCEPAARASFLPVRVSVGIISSDFVHIEKWNRRARCRGARWHPGLPAPKADMHQRFGQKEQARAAHDAAFAATKNDAEKRFLMRSKASHQMRLAAKRARYVRPSWTTAPSPTSFSRCASKLSFAIGKIAGGVSA